MKRSTRRLLIAAGGVVGVGGVVYLATRNSGPATPTGLAWGRKVSESFRQKLFQIASALGINPSYLMAIFYAESGISSKIHITPAGRDKDGGVIYKRSYNPDDITDDTLGGGFIGFTRSTAKTLGTNLYNLLHLSPEDQLDYVYEFYKRHMVNGTLPRNPSLWELYMSTYLPAEVDHADEPNYVVMDKFNKRTNAYFHNIATDRNKDGYTTVAEAMARIDGILAQGLKDKNRF